MSLFQPPPYKLALQYIFQTIYKKEQPLLTALLSFVFLLSKYVITQNAASCSLTPSTARWVTAARAFAFPLRSSFE